MSTRVYLPTSLRGLERFLRDGGIAPSPVHGHAVTGWLREEWPTGTEEEWEYAVLLAAADDSAAALMPEDRPRRVVVVAEVERVTEDRESTRVEVDAEIAMRLVRAVHADTEDVDAEVPGAMGDLAWFATQEAADLIA